MPPLNKEQVHTYFKTGRTTRPFSLYACCMVAVFGLVACSATRTEIKEDQRAQSARAGQAQQTLRQPMARPAYLVDDLRPKFATRSVPIEPGMRLPPEYGKVVMRLPGRHSLASIAELISRLTNLPVVIGPDALLDPAVFMPGTMAAAMSNTTNAAAPGVAATVGSPTAQAQLRAAAMGMTAVVQTQSELRTTHELNYQGSLAGLLDQVADKAGLQWRYQDGRIVFSRMVTRVFTIKSLFGGVKTSSQLNLGSNGSATSSTDSDVWSALEANLKNQLSNFGKLQIDSRGGTVTVTDAIPNVEAMARLIQIQNDTMMRQVILEVEVLQVDLRQEQQLGINWTAVGNILDASNITTFTPPSNLSSYSGNTGGILTFSRSNFKLLIAALEEFGKVNTAYSAVLTTTNRQPVPLGVISNEGYLKQVTAGTVSNTGASTGSALSAGTITTGFSLVVTPMVLDSGRVLLESALSVTALRDLKSFSSGVGALMNSIQLPAIDEFSTLQRLSVKLGDTLVMTGFEREILLRDDINVVRGVIPGSQRSKSMRQSTVIIITPRLGAP